MKVAILGARGIPAKYGGYDTFVEEFVKCFNASGDIQFLVYCRSNYYEDKLNSFHSARLVYLPAPRVKGIESLFHSFLSSIHVLFQNVDLIYFVDPANSPFFLLLRLFGKLVIVHTDGIGWKRRKWSHLARRYYKFSEWLSSRTANILITDNPKMQDYYKENYDADSIYISYGASNDAGININVYKEYGLLERNYLLVVARLEPENNTDLIIKEFTQTKISMPLVIVGDSPYNSPYMRRLQDLSDDRVYLIGRINNQAKLNALYKGAYLYIHGHEVGGTNPALLRAMNFGVAPVVIDVPFNLVVIEECGFVFKYEDKHLSSILEYLVENPAEVKHKGDEANKVLALYKVFWGKAGADKNELHKARVAYKEALNYDETCIPAYIYLGEAYYRDGRSEDAVEYWKKLLDVVPSAGYLVFDKLEKTLFELGQYEEITEIYERVSNQNPKDIHALFSLANIYEKKGMVELAIEKYRQILDIDPHFLSAKLSVAKLYQEKGRTEKSIDLLDDLIENLPPTCRQFVCNQCGHESSEALWKCPQCRKLNSFDI